MPVNQTPLSPKYRASQCDNHSLLKEPTCPVARPSALVPSPTNEALSTKYILTPQNLVCVSHMLGAEHPVGTGGLPPRTGYSGLDFLDTLLAVAVQTDTI